MKPDLTLLYSELGLKPNCSLAELQLAYRRRISELHAHRTAGSAPSPETTAALRDLISLYTTASRFHRRYGRLPGAPSHRAGAVHMTSIPGPHSSSGYSERPSEDRPSPRSQLALGLAVTFLVLLFALLAMASGEWLR